MKSSEQKALIDSYIREAIRECLKLNPKFHKTDTLVLTNYEILTKIFIEEINYIFLEAPTGSGKSVISYLLHFCFVYVTRKLDNDSNFSDSENTIFKPQSTAAYMLTSSKMLQEQISGDITNFSLENYLIMIKGIKNYECKRLTKETGIYHDYSERFCGGMKMDAKEMLDCYADCEYIQTRFEASKKECTILNYSYFLNVLKRPNPFFGIRPLTICDEAHLIPDIVLGMYNLDLNQFTINKLTKLLSQFELNFSKRLKDEVFNLRGLAGDCFKFFMNPKPQLEDVKDYLDILKKLIGGINDIDSSMKLEKDYPVFAAMFEKDLKKLADDLKYLDYEDYLESLKERPDDIYIKTENVGHFALEALGNNKAGAYTIYRHNVYDLSEAELCRKHFISKLQTGIFMSATLGNIEEFAHLLGLKTGEYYGFRLQSNFDFSKSPIYLTKSGYLNYNNFANTINQVLLDALYICENLHPNEKGIIHTSTFQISNMLREKVINKHGGVTNPKRYLFYENSEQKEACVEFMKSDSSVNYIIIGPSLYEGIDLKDDKGRFNIMIKTPYSGIDEYTKKKMLRFPFWYERQTMEKLVQLIGRTNRHIKDWSVTYLLDSTAEKLAWKMPEFMTNRIKTKRLK